MTQNVATLILLHFGVYVAKRPTLLVNQPTHQLSIRGYQTIYKYQGEKRLVVFFEVSCSSSSSSSSINTKSSVQCVKKRDSNIERGEGVKNKNRKQQQQQQSVKLNLVKIIIIDNNDTLYFLTDTNTLTHNL
ncbi:unnamed protein product [Candida parapsilosis]